MTQGRYELKVEQYYWVVNKEAYVLTFTSETSEYDNYQQVGESILNSFKIK